MFGRGDDGPDQEKMEEKRRAHQIHSQNLQTNPEENTAEVLRELSEIKDLPIDPQEDPIVGQLISKLASTANLDSDDIRSQEWVAEYIYTFYLMRHPPEYGLSGDLRAYVLDDPDEYREPLEANTRTTLETLVNSSRLARTRSDDFRAVEEATRTVSESVLRDESPEEEGGGGILGRLRG